MNANKIYGAISNIARIADHAKAKLHYKELAWQAEHQHEIDAEMNKQPGDYVYEALGECTEPLLQLAKVAIIDKDYSEFGRLVGPTMHAYLEQMAYDEVRNNYELQDDFEHASLTDAERNGINGITGKL